AIAVAQAKGREALPVADVFPLVDDGAPLESLLSVDTVEVPVLADEAGIEPTSPDSEEREILYEYDNSEAFDTTAEAELVLPSEAEEELLWRPGSAKAHPKHVQKMLDMLKLHNVRPRKTPLPVGSLPCDEETPQLVWQEAMVFRQCVGILLYLSGDIIEAQFGIRLLSQKMSSPCVGDMKTLKHLVSYLGSTQYRMLVYERSRGMTLAKKVLRIGIMSGLVQGNLAWENGDSYEALSWAADPILAEEFHEQDVYVTSG
ncbi:unnamed protein product, partial [Effrenium voratum]